MDTKSKWNRIYTSSIQPGQPAAVLAEHGDLLSKELGGEARGEVRGKDRGKPRALDIACGRGSNAIFLANAGLQVDAWDISDVAIDELQARSDQDGLDISATAIDITPASFRPETYDVIVNCHYLDRSLIEPIRDALVPGGRIFFQTFRLNKTADIGPGNPEFLLADDELLSWFAGFEILAFRDEVKNPNKDDYMAGRAYVIAEKPGLKNI